jgi:PAS domain S-box-containing protein
MSDRGKTNPELIKEVSLLKQKLQELKQEEAQHKCMEKELRASEEALAYKTVLLEAQSETSIDGILVVDKEGLVIMSNKRFGEIWGIPQSILDSKDDKKMLEYGLKQLKYPEEFSRRVAYLYENQTEKSRDDIEFADGRYLDRYSAPMISDDGKYLGRIWFFRDISERKQAEEELRRMNSFLNSILENIPDMIFLKDAKALRFVRFNRAGEDLLGYCRDELIGKNDYDFFPKEQADFFTGKDHAVLSGKITVDIPEESIKTRDKGVRTIHTKKVPILDAKGEPEYLLGISEDITERKQSEMQLIMREEELQAKTINLEELNVALRVLLEHREKDKDDLQDNIMVNVQQLLVPLIEKLKVCPLGVKEAAYVNALEYALQNIVSPFVNKLAYKNWNLTPKEIQVASLIKDGKSTKEIADILNLSIRAIEFHRDNIRKKLGLNKQNTNLRSYLMTLS